jgi:glycosyltransferase involved in cell wall biosynthesis
MRILLLNQFFYPDSAATSQFLTDLARHLAANGHEIRVICGRSSYADPDAMPCPPVQIVRTPDLPFKRGFLGRILSYLSFLSGALFHGIFGPKTDLVLTLTTPPALSLIGSVVKATKGARHFIWEMDVYPDIAVDLNVLNSRSWITRSIGAAFDSARCHSDGVIALGDCMRHRLIGHGIPPNKIHVTENWADSREIRPLPFPDSSPLRLFYSGNLGLAHDVETIRAAIHNLRSDPRFHFAFAGAGAQRPALESFCRENHIANVSFQGYRPRQELAQSLAACHIGVVTQKPATLGAVVPSKTYGLMAAGRPILFIGPREATPARIVGRHQCGWQIDPGDTATLIALLEHLAVNQNLVRDSGARAREAFLRNYDLPVGVAGLCKILGVSAQCISSGPTLAKSCPEP